MVQQPLPEDMGRRLADYLGSDSPVLRALSLVLKQAEESSKGLAMLDFTTEEGRLKAIRQQGVVEGLVMAVEIALRPVREMDRGRE